MSELEIAENLKISFEPVGIVDSKFWKNNNVINPQGFYDLVGAEGDHAVNIAEYFNSGNHRDAFWRSFQDYLGTLYIGKNGECHSLEILRKFSTQRGIFTHREMVHLLDDLQGFRHHLSYVKDKQLERNFPFDDQQIVDETREQFRKQYTKRISVCDSLIKITMKCIKNFNSFDEEHESYHGNTTPPLPQNDD